MSDFISLKRLGWQSVFQQQLSVEDLQQMTIARVIEHHRSEYVLRSEKDVFRLPVTVSLPHLTSGDWVLVNEQNHFVRLLERKSLFKRKAAGSKLSEQLIASNVDTLFIVCSLNYDFNLSRIERYLALTHEAGVEPVVILTKQDLCPDAEEKRRKVEQLEPLLMVELVNALDRESCSVLDYWCREGQTISLLGSSGVGKSTLVNTLLGIEVQQTSAIREDDSKGRHTTSARSMHFTPSGAILIDTPGMRELQLTECEEGVRQTFADIDALAKQCKFNDCHHAGEPGCAVQAAIDSGELDPRRLANYLKLLAEQARNSASLQDLRAKDRQFGKMVKQIGGKLRKMKKGY